MASVEVVEGVEDEICIAAGGSSAWVGAVCGVAQALSRKQRRRK